MMQYITDKGKCSTHFSSIAQKLGRSPSPVSREIRRNPPLFRPVRYRGNSAHQRAAGTVPEQREAKLIAKRLSEWEEEYFRFIECGIEPTNNAAELAIRQTVLDRAITQGSRGIKGNEWHERFWTVLTACGLQNVSVMNYLKRCLSVYFGLDIPHDFINLTI